MKFLIQEDPDIAQAHEVYQEFTQDDEMRMAYEARLKWLKDDNARIANAEEKGREETRKETAIELLNLSIPIEKISQATKLSIDEIKQLKTEH